MARRIKSHNRSTAPGEHNEKVASVVGQGEDGTRVKVDKDTPLTGFTVTKFGPIWDVTGAKCFPGDEALLDYETAAWMAERRLIEVEIKFDAKTDKSGKTKKASGGDTDAAGSRGASDASAGEPSSRGYASQADEPDDKGDDKPVRRRSSGAPAQHKPNL